LSPLRKNAAQCGTRLGAAVTLYHLRRDDTVGFGNEFGAQFEREAIALKAAGRVLGVAAALAPIAWQPRDFLTKMKGAGAGDLRDPMARDTLAFIVCDPREITQINGKIECFVVQRTRSYCDQALVGEEMAVRRANLVRDPHPHAHSKPADITGCILPTGTINLDH
jgi:hypothetical protein